MTPIDEKKYLSAFLGQIDNGPPAWLLRRWVDVVVWVIVTIAFLVLFQAGSRISPLILALGSTAIGIAIGYFTLLQCVAKQWPLLLPHISRKSVVDRLSALEP